MSDHDGRVLECAVLDVLGHARRPLTVRMLVDALSRRDVGEAIIRLAAEGRLRRARKGWTLSEISAPPPGETSARATVGEEQRLDPGQRATDRVGAASAPR